MKNMRSPEIDPDESISPDPVIELLKRAVFERSFPTVDSISLPPMVPLKYQSLFQHDTANRYAIRPLS